jgi:hypothetical protein
MEFDPTKLLDDTIEMLDSLHLSGAKRPDKDATEFPTDVSSMQPLQVSNLMVEYTAWYSYSASTESVAAAEESLLKGSLDYAAAKAFLTSDAKTIEGKKMAKFSNVDYVKYSQMHQVASARHELIKGITTMYDKYIWVLSRYLTTLAVEEGRGKY